MKKNTYEIVDLYRVHATDGGGMGYDEGEIGYYTNVGAAEHAASLSRNAPYTGIKKVFAIRVDGTWFELKSNIKLEVDVPVELHEANATRKKALDKLTQAEKIALGLA